MDQNKRLLSKDKVIAATVEAKENLEQEIALQQQIAKSEARAAKRVGWLDLFHMHAHCNTDPAQD